MLWNSFIFYSNFSLEVTSGLSHACHGDSETLKERDISSFTLYLRLSKQCLDLVQHYKNTCWSNDRIRCYMNFSADFRKVFTIKIRTDRVFREWLVITSEKYYSNSFLWKWLKKSKCANSYHEMLFPEFFFSKLTWNLRCRGSSAERSLSLHPRVLAEVLFAIPSAAIDSPRIILSICKCYPTT